MLRTLFTVLLDSMKRNKVIRYVLSFIVVLALIFSFNAINKYERESTEQQEQTAQGQTTEEDTSEEEEKDTVYYLHRLRFGKSNAIVLTILIGTLAGMKIKQKIDEEQKGS